MGIVAFQIAGDHFCKSGHQMRQSVIAPAAFLNDVAARFDLLLNSQMADFCLWGHVHILGNLNALTSSPRECSIQIGPPALYVN